MTTPIQLDGRRSATNGGWLRTTTCLLLLIALCVASRLPQLRSPNLLVDGDEAVLGLMAKHLAEGREFPIFFWGQRYALSSVETAAGAISFLVAGVGAVPLKAAGLALFTLGVVALFLAGAARLGPGRSFWIAALLVLNPAWSVWSLRDVGGYLTSFLASGIMLWMLAQDADRDSWIRWAIHGALTAVIYLAQPLWLPGLLPIVAVVLVLRRRVAYGLAYLVVAAACVLVVKYGVTVPYEVWGAPPMGNPNLLGSVPLVARQTYLALTGSYYLGWPIDPPGRAVTAMAIIWCVVLVTGVLVQAHRLWRRQYCPLSHLLFVAVWATIVAEWLLMRPRDPRYLLPLVGLLVAYAGVEVADLVDRRIVPRIAAVLATAAVAVLGAQSMRDFEDFNFLWTNPAQRWTETRRLQQVFGYLLVKDVRHVFSMNGMLDSQLTFYSNERIISRWSDPQGRYHAYVKEVNRALAAGEPVALVGYTNQSGAPGCWDVPICTGGIERTVTNPDSIFTVDDKYFVYVGPDRELLRSLGFRFWD